MNEDYSQHNDAPQPMDYAQQGGYDNAAAPQNGYAAGQESYGAPQPAYGEQQQPAYQAPQPLPQGFYGAPGGAYTGPSTPYPGAPQYYAGGETDPGARWSALCIIGFILSFLMPIAGLIISIIALVRIRRTGEKSRGMAIAGTIIGAVLTVLSIVGIAILVWAVNAMDVKVVENGDDLQVCINNECTSTDYDYYDDFSHGDETAFENDDMASRLPDATASKIVYELAM